jgi:hypothetical protein
MATPPSASDHDTATAAAMGAVGTSTDRADDLAVVAREHAQQAAHMLPSWLSPSGSTDSVLPDVDDPLEASTIVSLHVQAVGIQDIWSLVLIILDGHYARWCDLIVLMLQCYALDDHITFDTVASAIPCW